MGLNGGWRLKPVSPTGYGALDLLTGVLFLLVLGSGLFIWRVDLFTRGYFSVIQVHIYLGIALALLAPFALALHLRNTRSPVVRSVLSPIVVLGVPVVLALLANMLGVRGESSLYGNDPLTLHTLLSRLSVILFGFDSGNGAFVGLSATVAMVFLVVTAGVAVAVRSRDPATTARWAGVLLTVATYLAVGSGALAWLGRGDSRFAASAMHSALGLSCLLLLAAHFRAPRLLLGRFLSVVVLLGLGAGLAILWDESYFDEHAMGSETDDIVDHWKVRSMGAALDGAPFGPLLEADHLNGSASCGDSGCHPAITAQWEGSAHRFAADNDLYRKVIDLLVEERGAAAAEFCAACHDPVRALAGTVETDYRNGAPPPGEGVSCAVCHGVVGIPRTVANGHLAVREPRLYPGDEEQRNARIRLDPRFHRQNFVAQGVTFSGHTCGACHRLLVGPHMGAAIHATVQNSYDPTTVPASLSEVDSLQGLGPEVACSACHMPITTALARGSAHQYDHHFAGINLDLPDYARHPDASAEALSATRARVEAMIKGRLPDGSPFPSFGQLDLEQAPDHAPGVLDLTAHLEPTSEAGISLVIRSTSSRIGHAFPVGPFDLREVWQQVTVRDQRGEVLLHIGALGADGEVDPEAHRLGARELGRDGGPLKRHRLWDLAGIEDKRLIPTLGTVADTYPLVLSADTTGPLKVEVTWKMRRTRPEFSRWVYGEKDRIFPVHEVAWGSWELPLIAP
jgi:cytochrome b561